MSSKHREVKLSLQFALTVGGLTILSVTPVQAQQTASPQVGTAQSVQSTPQRTQTTQTRRTIPPPAAGSNQPTRTQVQIRGKKEQAADTDDVVVEEDDSEPAVAPSPPPEKPEKKVQVWTPTVRRGPVRTIKKEVAPLLKAAYEQMANQDFRGAVTTIREALKEDSQCITAQRYLAYCLAEGGLPTQALEALTKLIKQIKPSYFEWCTFGEVYLRSESLDNAERCYLEAQKSTPNSDFARSGLIRVYIRTDRADDAINLCIEGMKASKDRALYDYYVLLHSRAEEARKIRPGEVVPDDVPEPDPNASTQT
ncbi:MAG: tetratricopeptide repeat protein [Cyanobacteria bacterium]|nr:tetratricopeptide repeat protein [Cyanobacteriota bacterium]